MIKTVMPIYDELVGVYDKYIAEGTYQKTVQCGDAQILIEKDSKEFKVLINRTITYQVNQKDVFSFLRRIIRSGEKYEETRLNNGVIQFTKTTEEMVNYFTYKQDGASLLFNQISNISIPKVGCGYIHIYSLIQDACKNCDKSKMSMELVSRMGDTLSIPYALILLIVEYV